MRMLFAFFLGALAATVLLAREKKPPTLLVKTEKPEDDARLFHTREAPPKNLLH